MTAPRTSSRLPTSSGLIGSRFGAFRRRAGGVPGAATAPRRVIARVAAGGVDPPSADPSEWFEAASLVRDHGIGAILGGETMPAWAVRQVVEEMDGEVVARELECFANWQMWALLAGIQTAAVLVAGELEREGLADAAAALRTVGQWSSRRSVTSARSYAVTSCSRTSFRSHGRSRPRKRHDIASSDADDDASHRHCAGFSRDGAAPSKHRSAAPPAGRDRNRSLRRSAPPC